MPHRRAASRHCSTCFASQRCRRIEANAGREGEYSQLPQYMCSGIQIHRTVQATAIKNVSISSDGTQALTISLSPDSGNSGLVTAVALSECSERIKNTTTELQKRLGLIHDRLNSASAMDPSTIEEEKRSIQRCLDICDEASVEAEKARTNTFEDVAVAEDSRQVVVSTVGDLISA